MYRFSTLIFLLVFLFSCDEKPIHASLGVDSIHIDKDMAFEKEGYVFYYSKTKDSLHRIGLGVNPALSPDGTHLAYTVATKASRIIAMVDLKTGKDRFLDIQNSNHYGPSWNQDGTSLAFHIRHQDQWRIGVIDQNYQYKLIPNRLASNDHRWLGFSWTNDPNLLFTFTSDTLTIVDTAGVVKQTFSLKEICQGNAPSSESKFTFSHDQQYIFFTMINPEGRYPSDQYRANAPDALYKYDLEEKSLSKLSPDSLNCFQYSLSNGDSIYFSANPISRTNEPINIYSIHSNGSGLKKVLANAESVSLQSME